MMALPQTCELLVPAPNDSPPVRSPQAVHSFIASRIAGKELIEIGTRNGDGMNCFTMHAKKATAVEYAQNYCRSLERRAREIEATHPGKGYSVTCSDYRTVVLDADIITWWEQDPLLNIPGLRHARREQELGKVRATAEAILLFDPKWFMDVAGWKALCPLASWSVRIPFDERPKCLSDHGGRSPDGPETCDRAFGHFIVAGIPISSVGRLRTLSEAERVSCQVRHTAGHDAITDPSMWQLHEEPSYKLVGAAGGAALVTLASGAAGALDAAVQRQHGGKHGGGRSGMGKGRGARRAEKLELERKQQKEY